MSHAERCVVCFGSGRYNPARQLIGGQPDEERTCHACFGKGYIVINDVDANMFLPQLFRFTLRANTADTASASNPVENWWTI